MQRYLIFVTAGLGLLMYSIDTTVVAVALPSFITDLHTNVLWASWTMSIFFIAVTMAMPLAGNLSDSFGRKRVFLVSLVLFTVSSLACGLAPNIYALIAFRFLQGLGGASILPTASGIISDAFPEQRARMIGLFTSIYPLGGIIGPNLGGWIVSEFSWRYIFYINLPIGIALIVLAMVLLEDRRAFSLQHIDLAGAGYMSGAILFLMFALNLVGESVSPLSLVFTAIFLGLTFLLAVLFLRQEKKETNPLLDLALLKSTPFLAANIVNLVVGAVAFGVFSFIPLYVTSVHGLSTIMSGMILTPRSIGVIAASMVTSFLLRRWGYRLPMILGFCMISLGTVLLGESWLWKAPGAWPGTVEMLSLLILVQGVGAGVMFPASNNACIELMPAKIATIVGLRNMFRTIGGAFGVYLITLILHLSAVPATGFRIVFISFGCALLFSIPLVYLMPDGKGTA